jgi:hypothetical protein
MKKLLILLLMLLISVTLFSQKKKEIYFQMKFANAMNADTEVVLEDDSRVDVLTQTYAIEVDFAKKWAEGIGQALFYSEMTGKKAAVLLITDSENNSDAKCLERLLKIAKKYNITVWTIDYKTDKFYLMN